MSRYYTGVLMVRFSEPQSIGDELNVKGYSAIVRVKAETIKDALSVIFDSLEQDETIDVHEMALEEVVCFEEPLTSNCEIQKIYYTDDKITPWWKFWET